MNVNGEPNRETRLVPLEIVWRNPVAHVQADLRLKEASNPYFGWAEQARKIRSRRAIWNANHSRVA
jgi:hypothetical protein